MSKYSFVVFVTISVIIVVAEVWYTSSSIPSIPETTHLSQPMIDQPVDLVPELSAHSSRQHLSAGLLTVEEGMYSKDFTHVFYGNAEIYGADPATFQLLYEDTTQSYAKDESHVYYNGTILQGVDPMSLWLITYPAFGPGLKSSDRFVGYIKDRVRVYYEPRFANPRPQLIPGADAETFVGIETCKNQRYAKDKFHVYNMGEVVFGQNPTGFDLKSVPCEE